MMLKTPRWWYARRPAPGRVVRALLTPLSWLWAAVTARRLRKAVPEDVGGPVISVGNLTMGGSGKTPVAREIMRLLRQDGLSVHGLSRGHGGRERGPLRVDPALHSALDVGDEPLMLAHDGPQWIARDRAAGARSALAAGAGIIVMDDGHQNPTLRKALSLVVVDGETRDGEWPFGDGRVFPAGPMREPLKAGLARADGVVILLPQGLERPDPELEALFAPLPVFIARLRAQEAPPEGPLVGFAGIAKPWRVERDLRAAGADLRNFVPLADHATVSEASFAHLVACARDEGARLVTTEKDWVRLSPARRAQVTPWRVRAVLADEARFLVFLRDRLGQSRR
ncbi:MAG: tetraacyldisaccharide 4'-kinase [Brevundimonas sp.]|jgi:tetraacyldisaccharide 4'-kinase|uniref:tetraacyldisaccharide 4'-kinase n=1 Tax=Brevundimonas sp. TaxID=1871086 RepID=UPI003919E669